MENACSLFLVAAVVFLGVSVQVGESVHCWECNSKYDPNCGYPFRNTTIALADCSQRFLKQDDNVSATICRKITQKVKGETRIIRSCGYYNPEDASACVARAGTHLVFMHYCQCAGDGCNGAPHATTPALLVVLANVLVSIALSSLKDPSSSS